VLDLDGRIRIGAGSGSISDLFGILGKPKRHLTLKQIKKGIIQGAIERAMRR
jgi:hypothetical protein